MAIEYEEANDRLTKVMNDGDQVGVITNRNGQFGFRIFGEPIGGNVDSPADAKAVIEKHFE